MSDYKDTPIIEQLEATLKEIEYADESQRPRSGSVGDND